MFWLSWLIHPFAVCDLRCVNDSLRRTRTSLKVLAWCKLIVNYVTLGILPNIFPLLVPLLTSRAPGCINVVLAPPLLVSLVVAAVVDVPLLSLSPFFLSLSQCPFLLMPSFFLYSSLYPLSFLYPLFLSILLSPFS